MEHKCNGTNFEFWSGWSNMNTRTLQESFFFYTFEPAAVQSCNPFENKRPINRNIYILTLEDPIDVCHLNWSTIVKKFYKKQRPLTCSGGGKPISCCRVHFDGAQLDQLFFIGLSSLFNSYLFPVEKKMFQYVFNS